MRRAIQFADGTHKARSIQINQQRSINWYPVAGTKDAKGTAALYPTPGLLLAGTTPDKGRSNGVEFASKLYFVCGTSLISVDTTGTIATIGTIDPGEGRVELVAGRDYLMLVNGTSGWSYDGSTLAEITDGDFPSSPNDCSYLDGYFIVDDANDRIYVSASEDPTTWAATDFATAESDSDDVSAHVATKKNLYVCGSRTTEIWFNSGNVDYPFEVYPNGVLQIGILAASSLAAAGESIYMLGTLGDTGGPFVLEANGFAASVISDSDLNDTLADLGSRSDAIGFAYTQAGKTFYVLTFPSDDITFVYDATAREWHERRSPTTGRWQVAGHGYLSGSEIHYCTHSGVENLFTLALGTFQENGASVIRQRITQVMHADRRRIELNELELEFEPGIGLTAGQGSDPQVMLRYSVDGGKTWSKELWRDIGAIGDYQRRVLYRNLGIGRQYVFDISVSDPVNAVLTNSYVTYNLLDA